VKGLRFTPALAALLAALTATILALILAATGPPASCYCLGEWDWGAAAGVPWRVAAVEVDGVPPEALEAVHAGVVLGYVNAGYAEEWRSYWAGLEGSGVVLGPSGYEGEWLVAYWSPVWREALLAEALRVLSAGVDGVYLDNVDAYEYVDAPEGVDPAREMAELVCWLAGELRERRPGVTVAVNIGGGYALLLEPHSLASCIDIVYREELWSRWGPRGVEAQDPHETADALEALRAAASRGATIVIVDPAGGELDALTLCARAALKGFSAVPQPAWDPDYTEPPPWRACRLLNRVAALLNP